MLRLGMYTKPELSAMFGTRNMESLKRKMRRYKIDFDVTGRGESSVFTIKEIKDPFMIFCITELELDGRTDFKKVRNFLYYFLNDDEFVAMPAEVMEHRMRQQGQDVSRQTITNYITKLERKNLVSKSLSDYIYYFAYRDKQRITTREEYIQAWHEYWKDVNSGCSSMYAIRKMQENHGGVARKSALVEFNAIHKALLDELNELIFQSLQEEMACG